MRFYLRISKLNMLRLISSLPIIILLLCILIGLAYVYINDKKSEGYTPGPTNPVPTRTIIEIPGFTRGPKETLNMYYARIAEYLQQLLDNEPQPTLPYYFNTNYDSGPTSSGSSTLPPNWNPDWLDRMLSDNLDNTYHDNPEDQPGADDALVGYKISSQDGKIYPYSKLKGETIYYEPGSFKFGPDNYVPSYESSVFLSKLTNESPFNSVDLQEKKNNGFCKQHAQSPEMIEQKCNRLSSDTCSSTNCCILFGGSKCVAGDAKGPLLRSTYSNMLIKNKDYYYYKGKCYGNCGRSGGYFTNSDETDGYNYADYHTEEDGSESVSTTMAPPTNIQPTSSGSESESGTESGPESVIDKICSRSNANSSCESKCGSYVNGLGNICCPSEYCSETGPNYINAWKKFGFWYKGKWVSGEGSGSEADYNSTIPSFTPNIDTTPQETPTASSGTMQEVIWSGPTGYNYYTTPTDTISTPTPTEVST